MEGNSRDLDMSLIAASRLQAMGSWLQSFNIEINATEASTGRTCLHYAADTSDSELVTLLLNFGAIIDLRDNKMQTALHIACSKGHLNVVAILLQSGASVHCEDHYGCTPLQMAAENGHSEVVYRVLQSCATDKYRSRFLRKAIKSAAVRGHDKVVSFLLSQTKIKNQYKNTLIKAAKGGHLAVVALLLEHGVAINWEDQCWDGQFEYDALSGACDAGEFDIVKLLIEKGANVNNEGIRKKYKPRIPHTPLEYAALRGSRSIVRLLLNHGAKMFGINVRPLHFAIMSNSLDVCEDLLQAGAQVNGLDIWGDTPLHFASSVGMVDLLLKHGSDINMKNYYGRSPLNSACSNNDIQLDVITALLQKGSNVNSTDMQNRTALHLNSKYGCAENVKVLCEWGADIDARDTVWRTPLWFAVKKRRMDIATALLENGSDINKLGALYVEPDDSPLFEDFIVKWMSVNLHLRENLINSITEVCKLDAPSREELEKLKVTPIGNSDVTYYKFLGKSVDRLILTLKNEEILRTLSSETYKTQFPLYSLLISNRFQKGRHRKILVDRVFRNCSKIFSGLLEGIVEKILSLFSNGELYQFADGFSPLKLKSEKA